MSKSSHWSMTLSWGMATLNRLLVRAHAKPAAAQQPVVVQPVAPAQPAPKSTAVDFDDFLRALGAEL